MEGQGRHSARPPADWRERFIKALEGKVKNCLHCQGTTRSTGDHVVTQLIWRDGMTRFEEGYLMAMLVCNDCGHVDLYSLQALKIQE